MAARDAKRILLFVGVDAALTEAARALIDQYGEPCQIGAATSLPTALKQLHSAPHDLLFSALTDVEFEQFALLRYIEQHYPGTPVLVAGSGQLETDANLRMVGAVDVVARPLTAPAIARAVLSELEASVAGALHGIGLSGFLQLLHSEGKSCTLRVKSKQSVGYITIARGQPLTAKAGPLEAEDAVAAQLGWDHPQIEILPGRHAGSGVEILSPLMTLLMQAAKVQDECQRIAVEKRATGKFKIPSGPVPVATAAASAAAAEADPGELLERVMVMQLQVTSGNSVGYLYLLQGEIMDARTDDFEGEMAVQEILRWEKPQLKTSYVFRRAEASLGAALTQEVREKLGFSDPGAAAQR